MNVFKMNGKFYGMLEFDDFLNLLLEKQELKDALEHSEQRFRELEEKTS